MFFSGFDAETNSRLVRGSRVRAPYRRGRLDAGAGAGDGIPLGAREEAAMIEVSPSRERRRPRGVHPRSAARCFRTSRAGRSSSTAACWPTIRSGGCSSPSWRASRRGRARRPLRPRRPVLGQGPGASRGPAPRSRDGAPARARLLRRGRQDRDPRRGGRVPAVRGALRLPRDRPAGRAGEEGSARSPLRLRFPRRSRS